jgi:hypothetical protein
MPSHPRFLALDRSQTMPFYSVHIRGGEFRSFADAAFVRQAFCWQAFFFGPFWLARHRIWTGLFLWAVAYLVLIAASCAILSEDSVFLIALSLQALLGLEANRLLEAKLAAKGYHLAEIIAAPAADEAEADFYRQTEARDLRHDDVPGTQDGAKA